MVNLSTRGEIIQDLIIESYFVLKSELNNAKSRVYYWKVESNNGLAKGDTISFKIIKS